MSQESQGEERYPHPRPSLHQQQPSQGLILPAKLLQETLRELENIPF